MKKLFALAGWLVLALVLLLALQWPLRDGVQAGARLANDLGQIVFAFYMATAVTAASAAGVHLACLHGRPLRWGRGWRRWAMAACVVPWAVMVLWSFTPQVLDAWRVSERFADTNNPGYFLIKLAVWWMAALALFHVVQRFRGQR